MDRIESGGILGGERRPPLAWVTLGLATLGMALRLARYLQNYPLWGDETMLAVNLLDRRWADLASPLDYCQVCPIGFLALARAAIQGFGFSEPALRVVPVLSALASVPLFVILAGRVLGSRSVGTVLAVGLFAVAQPPIRYAGEFKPYATDLLVASALLLLGLRWREAPGRSGRAWALAAAAVVSVLVSLPSLFVIAPIAVVGLIEVASRREWRPVAGYLAFLGAVGMAVAGMAGSGQYQTSPANLTRFLNFWAHGFPSSWRDPGALARWLLRAHTGPLFAYPHGEIRVLGGLGAAVFACFVVGLSLRARRDPWSAALLALPFAMAMAAAVLRRYPYGVSSRIAQFLVPSTLILVAAGLDGMIARIRSDRLRRWAVPGLLGMLVVFGGWRLAIDLGRPYRTPWDRTAREFARWFWEELGDRAELVCVRTDLGIPLGPKRWSYDGTDQYLCYQRIYSPRHRKGRPPRWDAVGPDRPLRCVLVNRTPEEVPAFMAWIQANRQRYALREVRSYPATRGTPVEPGLTYVVCDLVPVASSVAAGPASRSTPR